MCEKREDYGCELHALRDVLVELVPEPSGIRMLLSDIEAPRDRINFANDVATVWFETLEEMLRHGLLSRLIEQVLQEYPSHEGLAKVAQLFDRAPAHKREPTARKGGGASGRGGDRGPEGETDEGFGE
jgi:hypothetical protein